jgi:hypothetical protein
MERRSIGWSTSPTRNTADDISPMRLAKAERSSDGKASAPATDQSSSNKAHGLTLSDMKVKITAQGHTATFRLYDTVAAKEFYDQLPLELNLTNFRDAQWMFYPPEASTSVKCPVRYKSRKPAPHKPTSFQSALIRGRTAERCR